MGTLYVLVLDGFHFPVFPGLWPPESLSLIGPGRPSGLKVTGFQERWFKQGGRATRGSVTSLRNTELLGR